MELIAFDQLAAATLTEPLAPATGTFGRWLRLTLGTIRRLGDEGKAAFVDAARQLVPIAEALAESAERGELDPRAYRDIATTRRRIETVFDHVSVVPRALRMSPDDLEVRYALVDLEELVSTTCGCFEALARRRELHFEVRATPGVSVAVDRTKLEVALATLLVNAFWHAPKGGHVVCTAHCEEQGDEIVIAVEDDGESVPMEKSAAVFDRVCVSERSVPLVVGDRRLSPGRSRDTLGLMGGSLQLIPLDSDAVRFEIRLPRCAPRGASVAETPPPAGAWIADAARLAAQELERESELGVHPIADDDRPRVLVIEDSRPLHRALVDCLEPECATASAFDGATGVELAIAMRPDVVLIDLSLRDGDGETIALSIRAQEHVTARILAMADRRDSAQLLRLLDAGVHDMVAKPLLLEAVRARVRRLIASKKTQDMLSDTIGQRDTDLIVLATEVADANRSLERVNAELAEAGKRAERASAIKSAFLRVMSHELKTPVTAMKLQLNLIERDPEIVRTTALERALDRFDRATNRLLHLVETSLEWARAEDGRSRPRVEELDLLAIVQGVVDEAEPVTAARDLEVVVRSPGEVPVTIDNDGRLARLVIRSLLDYSITVSPTGPVTVRLGRIEGGGRISIRDTGPTLSEEEREEVLRPFEHPSEVHRGRGGGSGLGVSAVCGIARAMGGYIYLEAVHGGGNRLVFEAPSLRIGANPLADERRAPTP